MNKRYVWLPTLRHPSAEKFEQWLNQESKQGNHLIRKKHLSTLCMALEKEQGVAYRYAIDMQLKNHDHCIRMYEEFGYDWVGNVGKVLVFAKMLAEREEDETPAFTQEESIQERRKLFRIATIFRILLTTIELALMLIAVLFVVKGFLIFLFYGFVGVAISYILILIVSYFIMKGALKL